MLRSLNSTVGLTMVWTPRAFVLASAIGMAGTGGCLMFGAIRHVTLAVFVGILEIRAVRA